jgi:hypothetical protein
MNKILIGVVGFGFFGLMSAQATNTYTLPAGYLGVNQTVQVNQYAGTGTNGGGGEFLGTVSNGTLGVANTGIGSTVAFWCVDDQEYFAFGQVSTADIVQLSQVNSTNVNVRYSGTPTNGWIDQTTPAGLTATQFDNVQTRYMMAAWLVSQYNGYDQYVNGSATGVIPGTTNNDIQQAIWDLTDTNGYGQNPSGNWHAGSYCDPTNLTSCAGVAAWISAAASNYQSVNTNLWAVVSWGATAQGNLYTGSYGSSDPGLQTFLVELPVGTTSTTPEPGFYGALALGLSSLVFSVSRRKKKA